MIKYSVIVPVYNSEQTLARCLHSLTLQNRNDVQVIVVNDGSSDSSEAIALDFAQRFPQILYQRQKNSGVSQARNTGLDLATGEYITFVDSDDYVTPDYYSRLDAAQDCDLLVFAHDVIGGTALDETLLFSELMKLETSHDCLALLLSSRKIMSPCNKRFRLELINQHTLRFIRSLHIGEDFNFCMAYALTCSSIKIIPNKLLCVDISNHASLSRKYRPYLDLQMLDVFNHIEQTIIACSQPENQKTHLLAISDYLFVKNVFTCISEEFKHKKLCWLKDRSQIFKICNCFRYEFSPSCINLTHKILRYLLRWKCYYPFYLVSYWVKSRKYRHYGVISWRS